MQSIATVRKTATLDGRLWLRWVGANSLSEAVGLGLTLALTGVVIGRLDTLPGIASALVAFVAAVLSGLIEATFVGLAQWWAMAPWFPRIEPDKLVAGNPRGCAPGLRAGLSAFDHHRAGSGNGRRRSRRSHDGTVAGRDSAPGRCAGSGGGRHPLIGPIPGDARQGRWGGLVDSGQHGRSGQ